MLARDKHSFSEATPQGSGMIATSAHSLVNAPLEGAAVRLEPTNCGFPDSARLSI